MWLLPVLSQISGIVTRVYFRLETGGARVPRDGPVLLVANHPNSLLDPALVARVAARPVRFLAKAPLFRDPAVGWLVRGSGSIPVYRHTDDPSQTGRNEQTFAAVQGALSEGAAVGIFPEGISHSAPSLAPLRTGAARIALGAAERIGAAFPIVPVGLTFRTKERFRSEALALVGPPIAWADLHAAGENDAAAVRELTRRIDAELRQVTINLERWEDEPLLDTAQAIYTAHFGADPGAADRVPRMRESGRILAQLRSAPDPALARLTADVRQHRRALSRLGLVPAHLAGTPSRWTAARWVARRSVLFALSAPVVLLGTALFWLPYRVPGWLAERARPEHDVRSTYKALVGGVAALVWIFVLAATATLLWGWVAGIAALIVLPAVAVVTLQVWERWREARGEARRFLLFRLHRGWRERLLERQQQIAAELHALHERMRA